MPLEHLQAPSAGIDSQSAPAYVGKGRAETSVNLLPGYNGKAPVRGGLSESERYVAALGAPEAIWMGASGFVLRYTNGGLVRRKYFKINTGGGIEAGSSYVFGTARMLQSHVVVGSHVYGISDYTGTTHKILRWNGVHVTTDEWVEYTNQPATYLVAIGYWLKRLFILAMPTAASGGERYIGGNAPVATETSLYWSDAFDPATTATDSAAFWQDDTSGLANEIVLDHAGGTFKPVDLANIGSSLAIMGAESVYLVQGTSPSNWTVRRVLDDRGMISAGACAQYDQGLLFVSYDGLYYFDGAELVDFSEPVKNKFLPGSFSQAYVAKCGREYVAVTLRSDAETPTWAGLLHVPTRTWTELKADGVWTNGYPSLIARGPFGVILADDERVWMAEDLVRPDASPGRDITEDDGTHPIVAETTSRSVRLAQPLSKAKITRIVADYVQEGTAETGRGWQFDIVDPTEVTVHHTEDEVDTADSTSGQRHRHVADVNVEVDEVKVKSTFTGNTSSDLRGELHDVFLEYQPAQRGTSF